MRAVPQPSGALLAMLAAEHADAPFGGFAGELANPHAEPAPPPAPQPLRIPKPDWEAERREWEARERREHEQGSPLPELDEAPESLQPRPASKRAKPKPTPRLDGARAWLNEQKAKP
jgi:hypothetical protein